LKRIVSIGTSIRYRQASADQRANDFFTLQDHYRSRNCALPTR
jgi:hypothetical protein